jgi:hypothetical protein
MKPIDRSWAQGRLATGEHTPGWHAFTAAGYSGARGSRAMCGERFEYAGPLTALDPDTTTRALCPICVRIIRPATS